jgi:hypothetical protein
MRFKEHIEQPKPVEGEHPLFTAMYTLGKSDVPVEFSEREMLQHLMASMKANKKITVTIEDKEYRSTK